MRIFKKHKTSKISLKMFQVPRSLITLNQYTVWYNFLKNLLIIENLNFNNTSLSFDLTKLSFQNLQIQCKNILVPGQIKNAEWRTHKIWRVFDQRNRYVKSVKIYNKRTTTILSHYTWPIDRKPLYKVGNEQKTSSGRNFFAVIQYAGRGISRGRFIVRELFMVGISFANHRVTMWPETDRPFIHVLPCN